MTKTQNRLRLHLFRNGAYVVWSGAHSSQKQNEGAQRVCVILIYTPVPLSKRRPKSQISRDTGQFTNYSIRNTQYAHMLTGQRGVRIRRRRWPVLPVKAGSAHRSNIASEEAAAGAGAAAKATDPRCGECNRGILRASWLQQHTVPRRMHRTTKHKATIQRHTQPPTVVRTPRMCCHG